MDDNNDFLPPVYEVISDTDAAPIKPSSRGPVVAADTETIEFHLDSLQKEATAAVPKQGAQDIARFSTKAFVKEGTLLTNVEEYSNQIRNEVDRQARVTRHQAALALSEAEEQLAAAQIMKTEAEAEVKAKLELAQAAVDQIRQVATNEGYEKGYQSGLDQAKGDNEKLSLQVMVLLAELKDLRLNLYKEYETEMVKQAQLMAKKVVHNELKTQPEFVLEMVKAAVTQLSGQGKIQIHVHPGEYDFLLLHQPELSEYIDPEQGLVVKKSSDLSPSSPVIETDFSVVELSMEKQFQKIDEQLRHCQDDRRLLFEPKYKAELQAAQKAQISTPVGG